MPKEIDVIMLALSLACRDLAFEKGKYKEPERFITEAREAFATAKNSREGNGMASKKGVVSVEGKKVVHKFATGAVIPEGAIYLTTITNGNMTNAHGEEYSDKMKYVWHYFLVDGASGQDLAIVRPAGKDKPLE